MGACDEIQGWLEQHGFGSLRSCESVSGGCINQAVRLETTSGERFFLKSNASSPADMFFREAEGLRELMVEGAPRVPEVFLVREQAILMEDLQPAPRAEGYWAQFGRQLAELHQHHAPLFGFAEDNYLGSTPQKNTQEEDGCKFFAEHRLIYQVRLARKDGKLGRGDARGVERLADQLRDRIPDQPASLLHGDLWSGNAITDDQGDPALIDPAVYYGWAEADLAMTALFGSFPETFYSAYQDVRPLEQGFRDRYPVYNLYHLLNHLNLFGGHYRGQVRRTLERLGLT